MKSERSVRTGGTMVRPKMTSSSRIEELKAEARYHRERFDLYKAKTYGPSLTTDARLRELERMHLGATRRLRRAEAAPVSLDEE
jgi:hypothetical protein